MSDTLEEHPDLVVRLRALAATAAPATQARPDLASTVLRRSRSTHRRRLALLAAGGALSAGAVAAAALPGHGAYFRQYQPSSSMEPTVLAGEQLVVGRELQPQHQDVVVVHVTYGGGDVDAVRRVIGLPGDRVACPDTGGGRCAALLVNGEPVPEAHLPTAGASFPEVAVPAGTVFLLGDSRDNAVDSRTEGPAPQGEVRGVVVRVVDVQGRQRVVPGAPTRPGPGDSDVVDPQGPVPPAPAAPAGG